MLTGPSPTLPLMALSARDRQRLDFMPEEHRLALLAQLSELAPIERKLERNDRALWVVGLSAIGAGTFAALTGLGLVGWVLAAVNVFFFSLQWERGRQRRAEWAWMREVGEYLLARDQ